MYPYFAITLPCLQYYKLEIDGGNTRREFIYGKNKNINSTVGGASRELTEVAERIRQAKTECEQGQNEGHRELLRQSRSDEGRVEGRNMFS